MKGTKVMSEKFASVVIGIAGFVCNMAVAGAGGGVAQDNRRAREKQIPINCTQLMNYKNSSMILFFLIVIYFVPICNGLSQETSYDAIIWDSTPPNNCPFEISKDLNVVMFTGRGKLYRGADTWYPTWASDDILYSPWTDGSVDGVGSNSSAGPNSATGAGRIIGDDPLNLKVENIGLHTSSALPYAGRYPCGSLVYNNVWYYGTYCVDLAQLSQLRRGIAIF